MKFKLLSIGGASVFFSTQNAIPAPITWGEPFEIVSEDDIDLTFGPLVYAINGGDNTGNEDFVEDASNPLVVTIGGNPVPFKGFEAPYGEDSQFGQMGFVFETFGDLTEQIDEIELATTDTRTVATPQVSFDADLVPENGLGRRRYDVDTGNPELNSILASQVFFDGRNILSSALNVTLNQLEPGKNYQVQIIGPAADMPRIADVTVDDGDGNSATGVGGFRDLDGDGNSHVSSIIGTFTADSATQMINVVLANERNGGLSALILTVEDSTKLEITEIVAAVGGYQISWKSRSNHRYAIEESFDLVTWDEINDSIDATGQLTSYFHLVEGPSQAFYRIRDLGKGD